MRYKKIMVKIIEEKDNHREQSWTHFCYVPKEMYDLFVFHAKDKPLYEFISQWAEEDFGFSKPLTRQVNIEALRKKIVDNCYTASIGTSGITKTWLCCHMIRAIAEAIPKVKESSNG